MQVKHYEDGDEDDAEEVEDQYEDDDFEEVEGHGMPLDHSEVPEEMDDDDEDEARESRVDKSGVDESKETV